MLLTPRAVEVLADRIEQAYLRLRPEWRQAGLDPRLWLAAAAILLDAQRREPGTPLDPELFVACQPRSTSASDPWRELTRAASGRRYLLRIRKMVRGLRRELREEIRRVESAIRRGDSPEVALLSSSKHLSPLGRFLAAAKLGRPDVAEQFRDDARSQHTCCPLYRRAAEGLTPGHEYPVISLLPESVRPSGSPQFSLN